MHVFMFSETENPKSDIFSSASCEAFCHYENTSQLVCFNLGLCTFCILWHFSENSSSLKLFKQNCCTLQRQRSLTKGQWPSPPGTFHILTGKFSYFVIRFLNHIFFVINFSYFIIRFLLNSSIVKSDNKIG